MKSTILFPIVIIALFMAAFSVQAQGTAFTYQGQLQNGGAAASGTYDLIFKLFNASSSGSQVGSTVTVSGKTITNGLFTASLDFGSGVFTGTTYWLELGVRTNGAGTFTTLTSARQQLTPTPYAITAENVNGLIPSSQLSGTLPAATLSGANGSGLTTLNAAQLITGTVPDARLSANVALLNANQTFTGINTFTSGAGGGRLVVSNASGLDTSAFTGLSLQYESGYGEGALMSSYNNGISGEGYLSFYTKPTSMAVMKQMSLDYYGVLALDQQNYNAGFLDNGSTNGAGLTFGTGSGEGIASQRTAGIDQWSLSFYTSFINRMIIMNGGFIGIGTTNPAAQLDVEAPSTDGSAFGVYGVITSTSPGGFSTGVRGQNNGTGGSGIGVWGSQNGSGWGGYFTSVSGIGVNVSGGTGYGIESSGATGIYTYGSSSALTIGGGAIHVTGAGTNDTTTAAFIQVASAANSLANYTIINNSICNGDPNAILLVTPNLSPQGTSAIYNNHPVGVWYNGSKWTIFEEDSATMPAGAAFNVLIIKN